jgi:hypothetical protein
MKTTRYTLVFLFLTAFMYGQNSTLFQNINYRAQELKHNLNETGDSLLLNSNRTIYSVEIFNNDFEKRFTVNSINATIPLNEIPVGRYTTEVKLNDKLIIITLLRNKPIRVTSEFTESTLYESETYESAKGLNVAEGKAKVEKPKKKVVVGYWILNKIQNGNSSRIIRRAGDKNVVKELIEQNKLDQQTRLGKFNELTIWEIYDKSGFMRLKRINPNYASVNDSESFNANPYFNTIRDIN